MNTKISRPLCRGHWLLLPSRTANRWYAAAANSSKTALQEPTEQNPNILRQLRRVLNAAEPLAQRIETIMQTYKETP